MTDRDQRDAERAGVGQTNPVKASEAIEEHFVLDAIEDDEVREALGVPHHRRIQKPN